MGKTVFLSLFFILSSSLLSSQTIVKIDGIARDTSFTVYSTLVKEQKRRPYIRIVTPDLPEGVDEYKNITYSIPYEGRCLKANLYRPNDKIKYPTLVMVHGGGWSSGDLSLQIPLAQQIAKKGYVTIAIEYRLSPEEQYPAAVNDVRTAIRWVRANAEKYGMDTTRIAISGCSAGGQLAMLVGMMNGTKERDSICEYADFSEVVHAVINVDGISDFIGDELDAVKVSLQQGKTPAAVRWFGGTIEEKEKAWLSASPINHVSEHSAPVCFINSSIPRFHNGRDHIIEKLRIHDIYSEVHTIEDTPHPFWLFSPWFEPTVMHMTSFLERLFKK